MYLKAIETMTGLLVLLLTAYVIFIFHSHGYLNQNTQSYVVAAEFDSINGLSLGNEVKIGGVPIGFVAGSSLSETYKAKVTLSINSGIQIPTDSSAEILSDSFLGGKYINLVPGSSDDCIGDGGFLEYTQSSLMSMEQLLSRFLFGLGNKGESSKDK